MDSPAGLLRLATSTPFLVLSRWIHTRCHREATRKNERHQRAFVAAQRGTFTRREARRFGESDQDLGLRPCQDRGGREG